MNKRMEVILGLIFSVVFVTGCANSSKKNEELSLASVQSQLTALDLEIRNMKSSQYLAFNNQDEIIKRLSGMDTLNQNALLLLFRLRDFVDYHSKKLCGVSFILRKDTVQLDSERGYPIPENCEPELVLTGEEIKIMESFLK